MSVKKQSKTPKQTKAKAAPVKQVEPLPEIKFDDAVVMGRTFVAYIKSNEWELGALADRVEKKYGKNTLARLAKEIDFPLDRLARCRSTYRAYKGTPIQESTPNFGAATALQADPERVSILQAEPDMKPAKARTIARANKAARGKPPKSRNDAGAIRAALELAQKVHSEIGHVTPADIDAEILRDVVKDLAQAEAMLRRAGQDFFNLTDMWKEILKPRPEPMFDEAAE